MCERLIPALNHQHGYRSAVTWCRYRWPHRHAWQTPSTLKSDPHRLAASILLIHFHSKVPRPDTRSPKLCGPTSKSDPNLASSPIPTLNANPVSVKRRSPHQLSVVARHWSVPYYNQHKVSPQLYKVQMYVNKHVPVRLHLLVDPRASHCELPFWLLVF